MSLDNPTEEEKAYLTNAAKHGCSRGITSVLIVIISIHFILFNISPLISGWIILGLSVFSLLQISIGLTDWVLGPFPEPPDSLKGAGFDNPKRKPND
jgi:hypothetical protein